MIDPKTALHAAILERAMPFAETPEDLQALNGRHWAHLDDAARRRLFRAHNAETNRIVRATAKERP